MSGKIKSKHGFATLVAVALLLVASTSVVQLRGTAANAWSNERHRPGLTRFIVDFGPVWIATECRSLQQTGAQIGCGMIDGPVVIGWRRNHEAIVLPDWTRPLFQFATRR